MSTRFTPGKDDAREDPRVPTSARFVGEQSSRTLAPQSRSPLKFFLLVFALSVPFWVAGALTRLQLLPGLPVSALAVVCPTIAASILVYRESETAGVFALLKRAFDWGRIRPRRRLVPVVLLMPAVTVAAYGVMRWMGSPLPPPRFPVGAVIGIFLAGLVGALGEELGWSGYVIDPLQERWSALGAAVLLGGVWAAWHVVPLLQAGRATAWIAWWCLYTVAGRVVLTWLFNNTGKSVFAAALYHDMSNVSWQLFPDHGSHWDPRTTGLILAVAAAIVTVVWGPRTLARSGGLRRPAIREAGR
jgi:hypothetical protein